MSLVVADMDAYYGESHVLRGVTLQAAAGQVTVVLGRNGVGKSTFANTAAGFVRMRNGSMTISDREVGATRPHRIARAGLALVPQGRRIFPSVTVAEHLTMASAKGAASRWTVDRALDTFPELRPRLAVRAGKLSGGEQQMLAIARALLRNPHVIILDEPSEGLAPQLVDRLGDVIATVRDEGACVVLLEQNLDFALRSADHVYLMHKGTIVYGATAEEFRCDGDDARRRYLAV